MEGLTIEQAAEFLRGLTDTQKAELLLGSVDKPFSIQTFTLDLGTAKLSTDPYVIRSPFKSIYVVTATDVSAQVNFVPGTQDSFQSSIPLKQNSNFNFPRQISQGFLSWEAQTGKTMTIMLLVDGNFSTGQNISVNSGGVSINDGSSFTPSIVTLVAATAGALVASDTSRKKATIYNDTGATVYLGNSGVTDSGATKGMPLLSGATVIWRNTAALYGYSVGGGDLNVIEES